MADKLFIDRMPGLFIRLSTDSLMAVKTKVGFSCDKQLVHPFMDGMAIVASFPCTLVPIHIPESDRLGIFMAGETFL